MHPCLGCPGPSPRSPPTPLCTPLVQRIYACFIKLIVLPPLSVYFSTTATYLFSWPLVYLCVPFYYHSCLGLLRCVWEWRCCTIYFKNLDLGIQWNWRDPEMASLVRECLCLFIYIFLTVPSLAFLLCLHVDRWWVMLAFFSSHLHYVLQSL